MSCFLLCCCLHHATAQNTGRLPQVSGDFKGLTIEQFADSLQKQTGFRFFVDTLKSDSTIINISANNEPLSAFLERAFSNSNFRFSIDDHNHVFIVRGMIVETKLSTNDLRVVDTLPRKKFGKETDDVYAENKTKDTIAVDNRLYVIGEKPMGTGKEKITVGGYIRDAKTGEPVIGASVTVEGERNGVATNQFGYYAISLSPGRHTLNIQSIGMKDTRRQVLVQGEGRFNLEMKGQVMTLKKVVVSAEKASNVRSLTMGLQKLDIKTIKQVPVVFGEADILRVLLTMPGVKTVGEASTGLNVRGGSADQNLILFNDATIYNPSHFFGLFSAFNPEVVKDVELYKASIPARYGGRLSSVLEINGKEGNKKEVSGSAGLGLLTSRINVEGPLIKDRTSFIVGARATYANWLLNLLPDQYKNSRASFYDINLGITHQVNKKNTIYLTAYLSKDHFNLNNDTTYGYGNSNVALKWKHTFNNKLYSVVSGGYDRYQYQISSTTNPVNAYKFAFDLNQSYFKAHFNYFASRKHTLEFGVNSLYYKFNPGTYQPDGSASLVAPDVVHAEQALESAAYLSDRFAVTEVFSLEAGVRYSMFNSLGPQNINTYPDNVPKTADNIVSTIAFPSGKVIKTYQGPEYRLSARYSLTENLSLKAAYNTQRQYIHMLSSTAAMAPTDIWKLSDPNINPQRGDQISLGIYRNLKSNTIETSIEVYYKNIHDYLDYKSGAELVLNHHIETDVIKTKGKAYGVELLIKKLSGKLNGWISYSYSRILLKQDDPNAGEIINGGAWYPANYDIPHSFTLVSNYRISHRYSISFNANYATGRPITLPIGKFFYAGSERTLYSDRNAYRIPDYFRTDLSFFIDGNHKVHQKTHNSWTAGIYNLTGRKNPYSVYYVSENGLINGYKLSIFGSAIPFINFNISF